MTRRDEVQLRMEIDGKQAISELGKLEMEAYEFRQELKMAKEDQAKFEKESKNLDAIKARYEKITAQIKELEAAGKTNTKEYDRLVKRLADTSEKLRAAESAQRSLTEAQKRFTDSSKNLDVTNKKIDEQRAKLGITGMTMRQLRQYQRELGRQMDTDVTMGTAKYEELKKKLQEVNQRINQQKADVRGTASAWSFLKTEAAKFGVLALAYLGGQELLGRLQNLIKGSAELSDAISDVQKTTGLANSTVKGLSDEFKNMNTRTARKELLGMAEIAGRLGIQSRDEVLGFVKAANQVNVALGDSLGDVETVMRELGKLTSTYNIKEAYGIEESLLRVGSAINELGMASTANEGHIVDFTRRMGGIAPLAKISVQDILGMGATLDALGQTSEVSSTALSKLFIKMAKNAKEYARFAKMEVADFVKLMNTDANEAFLRVLEGVKQNSAGITALAESLGDLGEDGGRVIGVLGTLANNTQMLRDQQKLSNRAFQEGTSISEEYKVKNENLAASLEKVQRWIAGIFINNAFLGFLEKSIGKLADWIAGVDEATRAFEENNRKVQSLDKTLPGLITRYDELSRYTIRNKDQQEEMNKIIDQVAKLVPSAVTEFDKYGRALDINTGKVREFTAAQQEANKILYADAIKEQKSAMKEIDLEIQRVTWALNRRDDDGDIFKYVLSASGMSQKQVKLTGEEIAKLQNQLLDLQKQKIGRKTLMEDLIGLSPEQIAGRAAFMASNKPQANADQMMDPIMPSLDDKELDEMLKKFKEFQEKIKDLEADAELARLDKDSREIAQIELKFQELREKALEYYNKGYLDRQAYNETINQINALQDEAVNLKIDEQSQVILDKRKKLQEEIELLELDDQDRAVEQAKRKFDALISQAEELGLSTVELERLKLEAIAKINADYDAKLLKQKQETNERQLRADIELRQAQIEYTMEYSRIAGAAIDLVGKKGGELTAFQKILALAQIGIDTGAAIMKAELVALQAASVGGPAAPFIYKATKLSIIGSILTAAARAKDLFSSSDVPEFGSTTGSQEKGPGRPSRAAAPAPKKSFYFGGPTGDGLGFGDQWGEYAGYVHRHEYVIPQAVRQEPIVKMQIEPILESLRMRTFTGRSFYSGGETSPMPSGSTSGGDAWTGSDPEVKHLLKVMIQKMDAWPREIKGKWVITDLEEAQQEKDYLESRYRAK
ncbi:MAG: phage tail tape measure protein [Algoriphagus aquaeductus]|uniref:phage tail tape measure protein n=1 Tax=Algoriphagus aquaeductus TaxID=475299 RepID=UPI003919BB06